MTTATQQVQALAIEAAERRLKQAAVYAELHTRKPLFQKIMRRRGNSPVLVRLDWPGVLRVFDPATGEVLAESLPGKPDQLAPTMADRIRTR